MSGAYPDHARLGVLAVVWRDGKVLLARRKKQPHAGQWGFPGGHVELGETLAQAAERELMEECGLRARAGASLTTVEVIDRDGEGRVRYHYLLVAMALEWLDGEAEAADDVDAVAWVDPEALPSPASPRVAELVALSRPKVSCAGGR